MFGNAKMTTALLGRYGILEIDNDFYRFKQRKKAAEKTSSGCFREFFRNSLTDLFWPSFVIRERPYSTHKSHSLNISECQHIRRKLTVDSMRPTRTTGNCRHTEKRFSHASSCVIPNRTFANLAK